uniref:Uncharacterized protein n=1 Tax=Haptolina ericina TaxID=156174 RepID=A0A7S3EUL3_9EUKA|mmetsp:Transcript_21347/g.48067  ORF Transcript_21347/g.48067 Transcript_21347/m.48067 type:complete len:255 (+) Transcript_21347:291-1055(+)
MWEHETGADDEVADRMRAVAMLCANAGQHSTATGLLQLAVKRLPTAMGPCDVGSLPAQEHRRLEACRLILERGALQPWPPTLVQLASFDQSQQPSVIPTAVEQAFVDLVRPLIAPSLNAGDNVLVWKGLGWGRARLKGSRTESDGCVTYDALLGGFDLKKNLKPHHVLSVDDEGAGAILLAAAQAGQTALVDTLLAAGVSVFAANASASTAVRAHCLIQEALLFSDTVYLCVAVASCSGSWSYRRLPSISPSWG